MADRNCKAKWVFEMGVAISLLLTFCPQRIHAAHIIESAQDEKLTAAQKIVEEARQLREWGTAESLRQAILRYTEALQLFRAGRDRREEATTLGSLGAIYYLLEEQQKALEFYGQSLLAWQAVNDRPAVADTLAIMGTIYTSSGELQKALESFKQALVIRQAISDRGGEASALANIGSLQASSGDRQKALDSFNQALDLLRQLRDQRGEVQTLLNIGAVYNSLDDPRKAIEVLKLALTIQRDLRDQRGEARTLISLSALYQKLGNPGKALQCHEQALPLLQALGDRVNEAIIISNIGFLKGYHALGGTLGHTRLKIAYFNQRLPHLSGRERAGALITLGADYIWLGEYQKALDSNREAIDIYRKIRYRRGEAIALLNIGFTYDTLGETEGALNYYLKALPLSRAAGDYQYEALLLLATGRAYYHQSDYQKAIEHFNTALSISRSHGFTEGKAIALGGFGLVYEKGGDYQKALDHFDQAAKYLRVVGSSRARLFEAIVLSKLALLHSKLGDQQKALDSYNRALLISTAEGDRNSEANVFYEMARVLDKQGDFEGARTLVEFALKIVESLRTRIPRHDLRSSFFASVHQYYEFYIYLLMKMHQLKPRQRLNITALQVSERARARSLIEMLTEAGANIRQGVKPELLEREQLLQQRLNAKAEGQVRLITGNLTGGAAAPVDKEITELILQLNEAQEQIRSASPRYAALIQPQPLSLGEIQQQVLDADTLLLEYSLGSERSFLWVVTPTAFNSYELPKREVIEAAIRSVYDTLTSSNRNTPIETEKQRELRQIQVREQSPAMATQLSRMLLGPVARQLGKKRLVIVADGALHYLPFGALPDPKSMDEKTGDWRPLVVEHEIVNLPSASALAVLRREQAGRKPAAETLAVLADPVFAKDDERFKPDARLTEQQPDQSTPNPVSESITRKLARVTGGSSGESRIARLPFTRQEAEQILALAPQGRGMKALDFEASRATAMSERLGQYRYLHFATHGLADGERPELSTIVLSLYDDQGRPQDGFLRAHEIYNLNLPAELVTLSACETGLGKQIRGEGLVSLTRGFMYAGAARVVVSLWSVNDRATAELMTKFYRKIFVEGERPAAALRAAQIEMWRDKRWESPYYWAAFTLQGEWR
jgi:CHAT domain-containing protein/Tfp pilus assembly protein PilF